MATICADRVLTGPAERSGQRTLSILGVPITNADRDQALALIERMLSQESRAHSVFFANAHTLNLATADPEYRDILRGADVVFGDGTGVRWAARWLHGVRLEDNVNGTDLVPLMFARWAHRGLRYFMLGTRPELIERAAAHARSAFAGWTQAGYHHGYVDARDHAIVDLVNLSRAHVLLVGMGNPLQERWIQIHQPRLEVPLCLGTGGLFDYWAGRIRRAPGWLRWLGHEWVHLLLSQPHKASRYLIGNPAFLVRVARSLALAEDRR